MALDISVEKLGKADLVKVVGEVDAATVRTLEEALGPLLHKKPPYVILDSSELKYINSRAVAVFVQGHRKATMNMGKLVFVSVNPRILKAFELVQVRDSLFFSDTKEEALGRL